MLFSPEFWLSDVVFSGSPDIIVLSGRAPASQEQGSGFDPQYHTQKIMEMGREEG